MGLVKMVYYVHKRNSWEILQLQKHGMESSIMCKSFVKSAHVSKTHY